MLFANSVNFENISLRFSTVKYLKTFKYHTNHIADYCIFKISSRIYNLNIPYIALRVEINLTILSKVSVN